MNPELHQFHVEYSTKDIDKASAIVVRRMFLRKKRLLLASIIIILPIVFSIATGQEASRAGAVLVCVSIVLIFWAAFVYRYWRNRSKMRSLLQKIGSVEVTLTELGVGIRGLLGRLQIEWREVIEIWLLSNYLFIVKNENAFIFLPLSDIDESSRSFLLTRVRGLSARLYQ